MTEWQTKGRDATGGTVEGSSMEDSVVINFRKPLVNVYVDPIDEDSRMTRRLSTSRRTSHRRSAFMTEWQNKI